MEMSIAEMADKYTILYIKIQEGLEVEEDLGKYLAELRGVEWRELHLINLDMWKLEEEITKANDDYDLRRIGLLYLELRSLNMVRIEEKNKIAKKHGGPREVKRY